MAIVQRGQKAKRLNTSLAKRASLVAQMLKNLCAMQETWVRSLGWEVPLRRKWQPTPFQPTLAWKIPWMKGPRRLQSIESQRVRHD